jgi:hypothetical protein
MAKTPKSYSTSSTSETQVSIPSNGTNVSITVKASGGGDGGDDSNDDGGSGNGGRGGTFAVKSAYDFTGYTIQMWCSREGSNGANDAVGTGGGNGGAGGDSGGRGADAGPYPYSGGGGGGGGSTRVKLSGNWVIVAGGGGGGGGASANRPGDNGGAGGSWSSGLSNGGSGGGNGGRINGAPDGRPNDGGGGGGGGAGASGGSGGQGGSDPNFNNKTAGGGSGGGSKYNSTYLSYQSDSTNQGSGSVKVTWQEVTPEISTFTASPNPQNSSLGTPLYSTSIAWSGKDYDYAAYKKGNGSYTQLTSSPISITDLPQTNNNNTPKEVTYTLKLCAGGSGGNCVTQTLTVKVRNDNNPSNSWTTLFTVDPSTTAITKKIGTLSGVDMPTKVSSTSSAVTFSTSSTSGFNTTKLINSGQNVYIRFIPAPFNTDLSGVSVNSNVGKTNDRVKSVKVGSKAAFNVTYRTRAPVIKESFNYGNQTGYVPNPDIDFINPDPNVYMVTNSVACNDIEIDVPIRSTNSNVQVSVNDSWKNAENLNPKRLS